MIKNNKLILKTQRRFQSEKHNVFAEEINKISSWSNDDKKMQLMDSIEKDAYGTSKDLVNEKEESRCKKLMKQYKKCLTLIIWQKKI